MNQKLSAKENRVLEALADGQKLRWCDMPDAIGRKTLLDMSAKRLIKLVANGAGPFSKDARWERL